MSTTITNPAVMKTTIVRPGAADAYWLVNELVERLHVSQAMDIVHITVPPGGGPPAHVHRHEDEMFYVVSGDFEFTLDQARFTGGAGTAVFLPRNIVHRFHNIGKTPGRLIVTAAPGGFMQFVASTGNIALDRTRIPQIGPATLESLAAGCARAEIDLLPQWTADQPSAPRDKPREVWVTGLHVKLALTSEQTNGQFSLAEITAPPGAFVPPHIHLTEDEYFYVVDGTIEFTLADGTISAPAGTFVHAPKQAVHGFRNVSKTTARLMDVHTPGGFDKFFVAASTPPDQPVDMQRFLEICRAHGMEVA